MNLKQHFIFYTIVIVIFSIAEIFTHFFGWIVILKMYYAFFLINPDYDLIFGIKHHRNWFTHSFLYPLSIYIVYRDNLNMMTADIFGIVLFMPCLIHLLGDFRINKAFDFKDQRNSWCISLFGRRLNEAQSYAWVGCSVLIMSGYIMLVFVGYWSDIVEYFKTVF